jgi:hypothetical protein
MALVGRKLMKRPEEDYIWVEDCGEDLVLHFTNRKIEMTISLDEGKQLLDELCAFCGDGETELTDDDNE